jgi:putative isomerase
MKKSLLFITALSFFACSSPEKEKETAVSPQQHYDKLKKELLSGWNTWDNRSIMTHVLLPEGLAYVLSLEDEKSGETLKYAFTGNRVEGAEKVITVAHTPDGAYTEFFLEWKDLHVNIQTTAKADDIHILVTTMANSGKGILKIKPEMFYGKQGNITVHQNKIRAELKDKTITASIIYTEDVTSDNEKIQVPLGQQIAISTKAEYTIEKIEEDLSDARVEYKKKINSYGNAGEVYNAIQNAINWTVVYDPANDRAVVPVSRPWSYGWGNAEIGGWVQFCWDNFFVAYMHSIESKNLAYNEAIQMCNYIDEMEFVPNFAGPNGLASRDRSQPPVGSAMILKIYEKYQEKWFIEYNYEKLLKWNRWWRKNRVTPDGFLTWGSNPFEPVLDDRREKVQHCFQAASFESGLDNTPMYDGIKFDSITCQLKINDVGLTSLFIMDCDALARMAEILGKAKDRQELKKTADKYRKKLNELWDDKYGLYLNLPLGEKEFSKRISPTNFYPLLAKAASPEKAKRMVEAHFYNENEFWGTWIMPSTARNDTAYTGQDYWRGSIWAPMNFLVYLGMQNYDLPEAKKDLSEKSKALLLKEWTERAYVRENYHAETGAQANSSDHFYHWGALLGMINLMEEGYVE